MRSIIYEFQAHAGSTRFNITTSDQRTVSAILKTPLGDNINGLVEIHGIAEGPAIVTCDYLISFPYNLANTYGKVSKLKLIKTSFCCVNRIVFYLVDFRNCIINANFYLLAYLLHVYYI